MSTKPSPNIYSEIGTANRFAKRLETYLAMPNGKLDDTWPIKGKVKIPKITMLEGFALNLTAMQDFTDLLFASPNRDVDQFKLLINDLTKEKRVWTEVLLKQGTDGPMPRMVGVEDDLESRLRVYEACAAYQALVSHYSNIITTGRPGPYQSYGRSLADFYNMLFLLDLRMNSGIAKVQSERSWFEKWWTADNNETLKKLKWAGESVAEAAVEDMPKIVGETLAGAANIAGDMAGGALGGFFAGIGITGLITILAVGAVLWKIG